MLLLTSALKAQRQHNSWLCPHCLNFITQKAFADHLTDSHALPKDILWPHLFSPPPPFVATAQTNNIILYVCCLVWYDLKQPAWTWTTVRGPFSRLIKSFSTVRLKHCCPQFANDWHVKSYLLSWPHLMVHPGSYHHYWGPGWPEHLETLSRCCVSLYLLHNGTSFTL